jgi:hypothetical protein
MEKRDCRYEGRIVLAFGERTGHCHEVVVGETGLPPDCAQAQFFELSGVRELMTIAPCVLRHEEHGVIALDPAAAANGAALLAKGRIEPGQVIPGQYRQGDVLLHPTGHGTWNQIGQREYSPEAIRNVCD